MSNVNPIKFGVSGNQYFNQETKEDVTKNTAKDSKAGEKHQKQITSNDVLGFMAAQNADIIPVKAQRTLEVSKYVTPEQEARIAEFMQGFESDYNEAFDIAANEFPEISERAAGDLALAYINSTY